MPQENVDLVISLLKTDEPQTPNEIAEQAKLNQKTVCVPRYCLLEIA